MYCGDETGAFIGDVGYSSCKFGYGGEDAPNLVLPSYIGKEQDNNDKKLCVGYGATHRPRSNLELQHIYSRPPPRALPPPSSWNSNDDCPSAKISAGITNGVEYLSRDGRIVNWDAWEATWEKAMTDLCVRAKAKWTSPRNVSSSLLEGHCPHPICAIEAGFAHYGSCCIDDTTESYTYSSKTGAAQKEQMTEILFETFGAPAVFIAPSPAVSAFSVGRPTGLVVDVGGGGCRATPVFDGLVLLTAQRRNGRGGEWLNDVQYHMLTSDAKEGGVGIQVHPRYAVKLSSQPTVESPSSPPKGDAMDVENDSENASDTQEQQHASSPSSPSHATQIQHLLTHPLYGQTKIVSYPPSMSITPSYHWNAIMNVMYEMKTSAHLYIPPYHGAAPFEQQGGGSGAVDNETTNTGVGDDANQYAYELPDGTMIDLTKHTKLCTLPVRLLVLNDVWNMRLCIFYVVVCRWLPVSSLFHSSFDIRSTHIGTIF